MNWFSEEFSGGDGRPGRPETKHYTTSQKMGPKASPKTSHAAPKQQAQRAQGGRGGAGMFPGGDGAVASTQINGLTWTFAAGGGGGGGGSHGRGGSGGSIILPSGVVIAGGRGGGPT